MNKFYPLVILGKRAAQALQAKMQSRLEPWQSTLNALPLEELKLLAQKQAQQLQHMLMNALNLPTQEEVEKIERKIVSLERRLNSLAQKAA